MESIGEILREARHNKRASLEDASRATRIKMDILEQLEADEFDKLAAPAYTKGFLKLYSEYLGLDSQAWWRLFCEARADCGDKGCMLKPRKPFALGNHPN